MSDHIPDPGQHRTIFCGHYANRVRGGHASFGARLDALVSSDIGLIPLECMGAFVSDWEEVPLIG